MVKREIEQAVFVEMLRDKKGRNFWWRVTGAAEMNGPFSTEQECLKAMDLAMEAMKPSRGRPS